MTSPSRRVCLPLLAFVATIAASHFKQLADPRHEKKSTFLAARFNSNMLADGDDSYYYDDYLSDYSEGREAYVRIGERAEAVTKARWLHELTDEPKAVLDAIHPDPSTSTVVMTPTSSPTEVMTLTPTSSPTTDRVELGKSGLTMSLVGVSVALDEDDLRNWEKAAADHANAFFAKPQDDDGIAVPDYEAIFRVTNVRDLSQAQDIVTLEYTQSVSIDNPSANNNLHAANAPEYFTLPFDDVDEKDDFLELLKTYGGGLNFSGVCFGRYFSLGEGQT